MRSTTTEETTLSDTILIDAARRGERFGFEQLVLRYQNRLFCSICSDVGCPTIAEDIVQDAFVRAFRFIDTFKNKSNFYTWLYRIALNSRRNYVRDRGRTISFDGFASEPRDPRSDPIESPSGCAERAETLEEVRKALGRLPEHHRRILILREFEGFDYTAIADVLQLKKGTVRSRLSRARAQLRKELVPYMSGRVAAGNPVLPAV